MALIPSNLTKLLANADNTQDFGRAFSIAYERLHNLARRYVRGERMNHTLGATGLVHEAYLLLSRRPPEGGWRDRSHFYRVACHAMRHILVDHARARLTAKRGGGIARAELNEQLDGADQGASRLLAVDESLRKLAEIDDRQAQVVELRFYGGFTIPEVAEILGTSPRTVDREWGTAKAWLYRELRRGEVT
ncbi:MAG: ECF-type sigma factor [Phycisphaerales bacterium]|nr:ECF-type sigma factor [Phycisphaerales bacterium]